MFDKIKKGTVDATISTKDFTVKKWKRFIRKRALKRVEKQMKYAQKKPEDYTKEEMRELIEKEEAVGVILYDEKNDLVGIIEQFRVGAIKSSFNAWQFEIVLPHLHL